MKKKTQQEAEFLVMSKCKENDFNYKQFTYINNNTKIQVHCNKCGYEWESIFRHFVYNKSICVNCCGLKKNITKRS